MKYMFGLTFLILVAGLSVWKVASLQNSYKDISQAETRRFNDIAEDVRKGLVEYSNDQIADFIVLASQKSVADHFIGVLVFICSGLAVISIIGVPVAYWIGLKTGFKKHN
jgi:hypothetical protein